MHIEWNQVTWYSKLAALIVFGGTFIIAFNLGIAYQSAQDSLRAPRPSMVAVPRQQPAAASSTPAFHLVGPKEGAVLCRGNYIHVGWTASSSIDQVVLSLISPTPLNPFGEYPAMHNENGTPGVGVIAWQVGTAVMNNRTYALPDGSNYQLSATALSHGTVVKKVVGNLFTIQTCQG